MRAPIRLFALASCLSLPAPAAELPCAGGWEPNAGGGAVVTPAAEELELDAVVREALESTAVMPGLAVGVLRDGEVLYARGFGVTDLERCSPVTPETAFYLLSVTKSFTGMLAALLQEDGALELDAPLTETLPALTLPPPLNPGQISARDLLLHRLGLENGAINFGSPGAMSDATLLRVLADHSVPTSIEFAYRNTGYVVFETVVRAATGRSWSELVAERVLEPLGLTGTTTSIDAATAGDFAYPYSVSPADGTFAREPVKVQPQMHAAGGMVSSVADLLRWLEANLEAGTVDGRRVLPQRVVRQAHAPQIQYEWRYGRYRRFAYGLGVHSADLDGELVIHHFGGPIHVSFAPEHGLGVVLLTAGMSSTSVVHELAAGLYDLLLEKHDARDRLAEALLAARQRIENRNTDRAASRAALDARRGRLARPAAAYTGVYRSDRLGDMRVVADGETLTLRHGVLATPLVPLEPDIFTALLDPWDQPEEFRFDAWQDGVPSLFDWGGRAFQRTGEDPAAHSGARYPGD